MESLNVVQSGSSDTAGKIGNTLTAALASAILAFFSRVLAASKSRRLTCSSFRSFCTQQTRDSAKEQKASITVEFWSFSVSDEVVSNRLWSL